MNAHTTQKPEIIDVLFDLHGVSLPASYSFNLWEELTRLIPALAHDNHVAVLPIRAAKNDGQLLLNRRTKLAVRIPATLLEAMAELAGTEFSIAGSRLQLGPMKSRAIQHYPTLHAPLAPGGDDEAEFLAAIQTHFAELEISANLICGIRHTLSNGQQSISGYSLVVHDLKPEASIRLQCTGYGNDKRYGCGIFMPYKVISDLE